ncbi:uncharacterized protein LOC114975425 [Acropora millepora]|uniref:uncharacterized protein LOC114975425 n=1 Tax=Acropora millepora TaxID=45264 RepID=UPI001CF35425|nr:uncharacterized protein LOC114975425 [Acropora millepora]
MKTFGLEKLLEALLLIPINAFLDAVALVNGQPCTLEGKVPQIAISRSDVLSYANFKEDKFSYLNIAALGGVLVDQMPECSLACLETPPCFSFNVKAFRNIDNKFLCQLLPSDMYNNTEKFSHSNTFHHFSIMTPCSSWPCKNNGRCLPLYEKNHYKCTCKEGFNGDNCENGEKH